MLLRRWFGTFNVKANPRMPLTHVYSDYVKSMRAAAVGGLQECQYDDYFHEALKASELTSHVLAGNIDRGGVPMFFKPSLFTSGQRYMRFLHGSKADVTPLKYIRVNILKHRSGVNKNVQFAATNRHYVAKAHNGKTDPFESLRRKLWSDGVDNDLDCLEEIADMGYPSVNFMDANNTEHFYPAYIRGYKVHEFSNWYDHIVFVDGPNHVWDFGSKPKKRIVKLFSDHDGLAVKARLIKRKK